MQRWVFANAGKFVIKFDIRLKFAMACQNLFPESVLMLC